MNRLLLGRCSVAATLAVLTACSGESHISAQLLKSIADQSQASDPHSKANPEK
jgi:hypothetical protein